MVSPAQALTKQFYEWERHGRGWHKAGYTVDLEPPFYPFFGHFIEATEIIDDGKQPSFLAAFAELFKAPTPTQPPQQENGLAAYSRTESEPLRVFTIALPRRFRQSAERMEQLLIMLSYRKSPISFEIIASKDRITLQWACREPDAAFLYAQMQAFFPECAIVEGGNDKLLEAVDGGMAIYAVDYGLRDEFMRPLACPDLAGEPFTALFGVLTHLREHEYAVIQVLFSGTRNAWAESIMTAVCDDTGKQSFFLDAPEMPQLAKEKVSRPLYGVTIRIMTAASTLEDAALLLQHMNTALVHASAGGSNELVPLATEHYTIEERLVDMLLRESHRVGMLLNSRELATFVHFPAIQTNKLIHSAHTTKKPPDSLTGFAYELGTNEHHGVQTGVSLPESQRFRHLHLMGATGTGKSTLLHSLIMQDIVQGNGICVLDPHGDLIENVLSAIPASRIADTVLIDPSDSSYPISFNILSAHSDLEKELLASDMVALFKRFSTSWGDQMNSVFANAIMAVVYNIKQYHLGDLRRFLIEQPYRQEVLSTITDPDIAYYWQKEFPILKSTSIGPILTRLDAFLRPKVIRNMVCQTESLNFQELMDGKKIILVKLSQGLLGMENSYLLGALIVSKLQQTAMARQAQAAAARIPFYCYIDEFHHFITPSMASILSGARKYFLGLVLAHQDMQQVLKFDPEVAGSLLANAGTRICFRVGDTDARRLADGFASFTAEDLQNLSTGEAIVRVNTNDTDFNIKVNPFYMEQADYRDEVVAHSRRQHSVIIAPSEVRQAEPATKPPVLQAPIMDTPAQEHDLSPPKEMREHRYLQTFVKALAESHGYKASVEVPTPDGTGQVDVLLEKDGQSVAVEISVTTSPEWELHNIRKCLASGYSRIVVCVVQPGKVPLIKKQISAYLKPEEQRAIQVMSSTDLASLFASNTAPQTEMVIKGYRVKVNYETDDNKQNLLRSILNATKKA